MTIAHLVPEEILLKELCFLTRAQIRHTIRKCRSSNTRRRPTHSSCPVSYPSGPKYKAISRFVQIVRYIVVKKQTINISVIVWVKITNTAVTNTDDTGQQNRMRKEQPKPQDVLR